MSTATETAPRRARRRSGSRASPRAGARRPTPTASATTSSRCSPTEIRLVQPQLPDGRRQARRSASEFARPLFELLPEIRGTVGSWARRRRRRRRGRLHRARRSARSSPAAAQVDAAHDRPDHAPRRARGRAGRQPRPAGAAAARSRSAPIVADVPPREARPMSSAVSSRRDRSLPRRGRRRADPLRPRRSSSTGRSGEGRPAARGRASAASSPTGRWARTGRAMRPDADLTPPGHGDASSPTSSTRSSSSDVTLVGNDTGGAICQLVATRHPERLGRLVLTPCDAYENFLPPAFRSLPAARAASPAAICAIAAVDAHHRGAPRAERVRLARQAPIPTRARARLARAVPRRRRGPPRHRARSLRGISKRYTLEAAEQLARLRRPDAARLGARGPLLQVRSTPSASPRRSRTRGWSGSRTRGRSSPRTSPSASPS